MTSTTREISRYLEDAERGFPCFVGHGEDAEPCGQPAVMVVYGIPMCEAHGEEARAGALEELHQDAGDFFERFDTSEVPEISNPLVRAAVRRWRLTVPEGLEYVPDHQAEELLLRAYPFRADNANAESAGQIADPIPGNFPLRLVDD